MITEREDVQLEAPGAGLPATERFIMGKVVPLILRFVSRESFSKLFKSELVKINTLVASLSEDEGSKRVLIDRIRGIEDSSRHWSVHMTLHHLHIVNSSIMGVIRKLSRGEKPEVIVKIKDVKPDPESGLESLVAFQKSAELLTKAVAGVEDLDTELTHDHPWFGPFNAKRWHSLSAIHMRIHRIQIEKIIEGLKA